MRAAAATSWGDGPRRAAGRGARAVVGGFTVRCFPAGSFARLFAFALTGIALTLLSAAQASADPGWPSRSTHRNRPEKAQPFAAVS